MTKPSVDICMIVHNDVRHDGRVLKEAGSLAKHGWHVVVLGITLGKENLPEEEQINGFTIIRVTPKLFRGWLPGRLGLLLSIVPTLPAMALRLRSIKARVYHANDFPGLLHTWLAGLGGRTIVYDSHELYFDRSLPDLPGIVKLMMKLLRPFEKPMARRAQGMITVSDGFADRFVETLGVERPVVVRNAVDLRTLQPSGMTFPTGDKTVVIHTGYLLPGRHLHELVLSSHHLPDNFAVILIGRGGSEKQRLEKLVEEQNLQDRVLFLPPVSVDTVATTMQQAQVSIVLTTFMDLGYKLTLPNKLFEAIAAGIPVVVGPSDEIVSIVERYDMGVICDPTDPKSIADAILEVLKPENYARFKQGAERAREDLNWEVEEKKLIALYEGILNNER